MTTTNKRILLLFIVLLMTITLFGCSERTDSYKYTVTFESNGGTIFPEYEGTEMLTMPTPKKDGYTFEGWYKEKDLSGERVYFPYVMNDNIMLYAKYIDNNIGNLELVYNLIDGAYEVTGYNGASFVIYIPENHNSLPVIRLCQGFIKNLYNTTTIYISKNVNEIQEKLYQSRRLVSIDVNGNNEVYSSLDGILYNKERTTLFCYPAGRMGSSYILPEETTTIAPYAIRNNFYLQNVTLNKVVSSLDNGLYDLINLRAIIAPQENENFSIEEDVLYNKDKTKLIIFPARSENKDFKVPDTVVEMAENAFLSSVVNTISIGSKVSKVSAFQNCKYLRKITVAEDNLNFSSIDGVLFDIAGKNLIKFPSIFEVKKGDYDYTFPNSVENIESLAFDNISTVKSISINSSVNTISSYAFTGDCSITEIFFQPNSQLRTINDGALVGCKNLTKLTLSSRKPPAISETELIKLDDLDIFVPANMRGLYEELWKEYDDKLKNGEAIANYRVTFDSNGGTFVGNVEAGYIITEPVTSKGDYAFLGWYDNKEGTGQRYTFPLAIVRNITLYAAWE